MVFEMPAYVDESYRQGGRYLIGVVVTDREVGSARQALRSQARRLKKPIHFNALTPGQRSTVMEAIGALEGMRSYAFEHRMTRGESQMNARAIVVTAAVKMLQEQGVSSLVLDHFQGADRIDGATIRRAREQRRDATLHYRHAHYSDEPLLWVADAIAFNAGVKHPEPMPSWHHGTTKVV